MKGQHDLLRANAARTPQSIRLTVPHAPDYLYHTCRITFTHVQVLASGSGCQALDALIALPAPRAPLALGLPLPDGPYFPRPYSGFSDLCKGLAWGVSALLALTSPREAGAGWMAIRFPTNLHADPGAAASLAELRSLWHPYSQHLESAWDPKRDWESCRARVMLPDGQPPPQIVLSLARLGPFALLSMRQMLFGADAHLPTCLLGLAVALATGRTSLIVQGVAGSGKTRTMVAAAMLLRAIFGMRFLWLAQQHPALRSAAQDASELLQDAHDSARAQFVRVLSGEETSSTAIDSSRGDADLHAAGVCIVTIGAAAAALSLPFATPLKVYISTADVAIIDEAQMSGSPESVRVVRALPDACLLAWQGDRRQPMGGC